MVPLPEDTVQEMRLAPAAAFASPAAVVDDGRLSRRQKIDILNAWAHDCHEQSTADSEGMPPTAGNPGAALKAVEDALARLDAVADAPNH